MRTSACVRSLIAAAAIATVVSGGAPVLCVAALRAQAPSSNSTPGSKTAKPQAQDSPSGSATAATADAAKARSSPADDNPFPEEQSKAAQKEASDEDRADRKAADAGPAGGGDSFDPGKAASSSSRDKLAGMDVLGDHDARIANGAGGTIVNPKLSLEDLKVGQQYLGMGNYQGAYERFKEACKVNPANVEAVFYLAEAARKTAHLDESAENYRIYLQVQPDGSKAKAARKALAQLQGK